MGQLYLLAGVAMLMVFTRVVTMVTLTEWVSSLTLDVACLF